MQKELLAIANEIMELAHDEILMNLRFLEGALFAYPYELREGMGRHGYSVQRLYVDPVRIIRQFETEPHIGMRLYLHGLFHQIFLHGFRKEELKTEIWDLATDIAVENVVLQLGLPEASLHTDQVLESRLALLKKQAGGLSAEKIYRYYLIYPPSKDGMEEWKKLTGHDEHLYHQVKEELELSGEEWKKLAQRVQADLRSFSKDAKGGESITANLKEATREKVDYTDFLRKFMSQGEHVSVDIDTFDYIYYSYGLELYGNMPLIEPLEYKEDHRIRDFVIALDTSASCKGPLVQAFLKKTYEILQSEESFFSKVNVHILQCDHELRKDTKITSVKEFDTFMQNARLIGFGGTDFRPVFSYVEELIEQGEFEDLRGLIYFTDGYGLFPSKRPDFDTAFVYLGEDENAPKVPPWAVKVVLMEEQLEV